MTMSTPAKIYKACVATLMVAALSFGVSAKLSGWDVATANPAAISAR